MQGCTAQRRFGDTHAGAKGAIYVSRMYHKYHIYDILVSARKELLLRACIPPLICVAGMQHTVIILSDLLSLVETHPKL